jgi:hypothetical protein
MVKSHGMTQREISYIKHDTYFIYNLYKNFIAKRFIRCVDKPTADVLSVLCLFQGPSFLDKMLNIRFNGNKIKISSNYFKNTDDVKWLAKHISMDRFAPFLTQYQVLFDFS